MDRHVESMPSVVLEPQAMQFDGFVGLQRLPQRAVTCARIVSRSITWMFQLALPAAGSRYLPCDH